MTLTDVTGQSFTDSGSLAGTYHFYGGGLPDSGAGLVVHLHGDGAYEYDNPTDNYCLAGNRGLIAVAKAKGYALLVPKAPDTTGTVTWWEAGARNAQWLSELIQNIYTAKGINTSKVWLVGYSGGAQFITERFVPLYGKAKLAGGGALILGGGDAAISTPVGWDSTFKAAFPMYWVTGGQDDGTYSDDSFDALSAANAGKTYYAGQGFTTTQLTPPGIGHEIDGAFGPMLDDVLPAQLGYTVPSRTPGSTRPTLITSYLVTGTNLATTTTPSFTPAAGEVIAVKCWNADLDSPNIAGVFGGGLTFATKQHIQATGKAEAWVFVGEVGSTSPGSMTVSVSWFGTNGQHGIIVERWSTGLVAGVPAQSAPVMGSGAPSATLTPSNANSVLTWIDTDWNVTTGTATYRSSATQTQTSSTSNVRAYAAYQNTPSTSAQTVGLSAPSGQAWALGAIELLPAPDAGGGGGGSPPPPSSTGVARNLFPNPACANNGTGWSSVGGAYARSTSVSGALPRTTGWEGTAADDSNSPRAQVTAGQQYVYSVSIHANADQSFNMLVNFYAASSGGAFIANSGPTVPVVLSSGQTQRFTLGPFTVPSGAVSSHIKFNDIDAGGVEITAIRCTPYSGDLTADGAYFDGASSGASWDGTAGDSTSTRRVLAQAVTATDVFSVIETPLGPVASEHGFATDSFVIASTGVIDEQVHATDGFLIAELAYDEGRGRVRISAFTFASTVTQVRIQRRVLGGKFEDIRGGTVQVLEGTMNRAVDDYEYPAGEDVEYRIQGLGDQGQVIQQAVARRSASGDVSWLKFVANPQLNRKIHLTDWSEISRDSRADIYEVVGRSDPVVVTDVHGSRRTTIQVITPTVPDTKALDDALSQGHPVFLQVPADLQLPSIYASVGNFSYERLSPKSVRSRWKIPLIEVAPPPMTLVGNTSTYATVLEEYTTYADILDRVDRYRDLVS